jgi:uncharacterized protein (UPF0335 family)
MTTLHQYAEQIASKERAKKELAEDIRDLYTVAASNGFNSRALKRAIKIASMDASQRAKHDADQTDLDD